MGGKKTKFCGHVSTGGKFTGLREPSVGVTQLTMGLLNDHFIGVVGGGDGKRRHYTSYKKCFSDFCN